MPFKSTMTNIYMFLTVAVVCASIAASAPIEVDQVEGDMLGTSFSVGKVVLDDTTSYKVTAPFQITMGSGNDKMGFSGSIEAKTNDNPTCAGIKTITIEGSFKLILPESLTKPITDLRDLGIGGVKPFEDIVPDISAITDDGVTITQEIDVSAATADVDIKLSEKLSPDKQKVLELLGTELTFRIALSELRLYEKGVEMPLYIIVEIVKKENMKLPSSECGDRGANICSQTVSCDVTGVPVTNCQACEVLCKAAGGAIDAALDSTGNAAVFEETYNVAELLATVAALSGTTDLKGAVRLCAAAKTKYCFGIGTVDEKCDTLSVATQHHLNVFCAAAVVSLAYLQ